MKVLTLLLFILIVVSLFNLYSCMLISTKTSSSAVFNDTYYLLARTFTLCCGHITSQNPTSFNLSNNNYTVVCTTSTSSGACCLDETGTCVMEIPDSATEYLCAYDIVQMSLTPTCPKVFQGNVIEACGVNSGVNGVTVSCLDGSSKKNN